MITTDQSELEVAVSSRTPHTNPHVCYDDETAFGLTASSMEVGSPTRMAQPSLPTVVFLSALALMAPAIPLNAAPGETSSLVSVRYDLARPTSRRLTICEARLLALAAHAEAEKLIREDRSSEARTYLNYSSECDGH